MNTDILKRLNAARAKREAVCIVADLESGASRLVTGENDDPLNGEIAERFRSGKSGIASDGSFLRVYLPSPRLVVIGAVHISQALYPMAQAAGFDLTIIDPRTAFATPERFYGVDLHADWPSEILPRRPLDRWTAVAALTHDPKIDDDALIAALDADCFYVGALGSRKTNAKRVERLGERGLSAVALSRIAAPIGLDIGASGPAEIAVAVLAQVIEALRKGAR